jgi:hypothetical protein
MSEQMNTRPASYIQLVADGATLQLVLGVDGDRVTMPLGASECVAIACELLEAARVRLGRAGWPPKAS